MLGSNPVMYSFFFSFCLFFFFVFGLYIPLFHSNKFYKTKTAAASSHRPMVPGSNPAKYPFFFLSVFLFFFFFGYRFCFVLFCFVCLFVCCFFFNINLNSCYLIKSNTNKLCSNHPSFLLNFGVNYSCSFYAFLFHCNIFYKTKKVATRSHRLPFIFVAVVLVIRER